MNLLTPRGFLEICQSYLDGIETLWVAYSGGVDSHVLLDVAHRAMTGDNELHIKLAAVHVNHGLSLNADSWAAHCQTVCDKLQVPLLTLVVDATATKGQSPEEAARIARQAAWQDQLGPKDLLLLAHHSDDQAETILYRLFRGTGPIGMAGMSVTSKLGDISCCRPLLTFSKDDILKYAKRRALSWIVDESNHDTRYDRNFIRHKILPELKTRWPSVSESIARAGRLSGEMSQEVEKQTFKNLPDYSGSKPGTLSISKVMALSVFWRNQSLRAWLKGFDIIPSNDQLQHIHTLVIQARRDAKPLLKIGDYTIRRFRDDLYCLPYIGNYHLADNFERLWQIENPLELPDNRQLHFENSSDAKTLSLLKTATVRIGCQGKKSKKVFQHLGVPPWDRANYPLIFKDKTLVAIADLWNCPRYFQKAILKPLYVTKG